MRNSLGDKIKLLLQNDYRKVFDGVFDDLNERFSFCMCNPPFHESASQMDQNPVKRTTSTILESVCENGEVGFISRMVEESAKRPRQFIWFSTLVARAASMKLLKPVLAKSEPTTVKRITLFQGKQTRWMLCWSFMAENERTGLMRYLASEAFNGQNATLKNTDVLAENT